MLEALGFSPGEESVQSSKDNTVRKGGKKEGKERGREGERRKSLGFGH